MDATCSTNCERNSGVNRDIFVLVPSLHPVGPVKGAIALCNALVNSRRVSLVALKYGPGADAYIHPDVQVVNLGREKGWFGLLFAYRKLLVMAGRHCNVSSISFCFSADMINLFCHRQAEICSSVRGNLLKNYRMEYGLAGVFVAVIHLVLLRYFDHVVAMNNAMAAQIHFYTRSYPVVIGNFIDENALELYRTNSFGKGSMRYVFLGSLTQRKQPLLLLQAISELLREGNDVCLDIIGDGKLRTSIEEEVDRQGLAKVVILHGHLADPYPLVARADAMILPSLSEGVSRAGLEALYLGTPCVLRAVDGNAEMVISGKNGFLFSHDDDLPEAMLAVAKWSRNRSGVRSSLLPAAYNQRVAAKQYLSLVEGER